MKRVVQATAVLRGRTNRESLPAADRTRVFMSRGPPDRRKKDLHAAFGHVMLST